MNEQDAWKTFTLTGSVFDYLKYKNIAENKTETKEKENENKNTGTCTQTTEYR